MLLLISQSHSPELCSRDDGGSKILYNPNAEDVKLPPIYGAYPEHIIYDLVEAEQFEAIEQFLMPGFKRCTSKITPVNQKPFVK